MAQSVISILKTALSRWRWGVLATVAVTLLAMYPQFHLWSTRGENWNGSYAIGHPDEVSYLAYVNAIIDGRPRRNDPFTGRDDLPQAPQPESLFSIQFVPAYAIALPARFFGLKASGAFIALTLITAVTSSLIIFSLFVIITKDVSLSACGVLFVLCFGTLTAAQGVLRHILNLPYLIPLSVSNLFLPTSLYGLPFLRLYQPAAAFPLFFFFCILVWYVLTCRSKQASILLTLGAGLVLATLIFSYFFSWTTAAAWLICLAMLYLFARPDNWQSNLIKLGVIGSIGAAALLAYFLLISRRAESMDDAQALRTSRSLDLFRFPEVIALVILLLLVYLALRSRLSWKDPAALFPTSLTITPLIVFNQQVFTGHTLQPFHYEWFIANYLVLTALVLVASLWRRSQIQTTREKIKRQHFLWCALIAFCWGAGEVLLQVRINTTYRTLFDEVQLVGTKLRALADLESRDGRVSQGKALRPIVFSPQLQVADMLPAFAPQALLWAPRMLTFPGASLMENKERFFLQLYYSGYDEQDFRRELDRGDWSFYSGLFEYGRLSPVIDGTTNPITVEEIHQRLADYLSYSRSLTCTEAQSPALSYVVTSVNKEWDSSHLDLWYERTAGERVGNFMIYQVKPRAFCTSQAGLP